MSTVLSHIDGAPIRTRRPRNREEDGIQASIVQLLRLVLKEDQFKVFSIPNGAGKLSKPTARRLKAMGVLAGVADIEIVARGGLAHFMEVKTDEGRPSQAQRDFKAWCDVNHVPHAYVRSVDDAQRALAEWGLVRGIAA